MQITAAKTVVVVGGGSVGVEVASEVADAFPDKKVTIVASGDLLDRMAPSAQQYAEEWMKKHNVEVLTGERIRYGAEGAGARAGSAGLMSVNTTICVLANCRSDWGGLDDNMPAAATLKTSSGRTLAADLAFKCVGVTPATGTYAASLSSEQLGPRGAIEVYPTLQVSAAAACQPNSKRWAFAPASIQHLNPATVNHCSLGTGQGLAQRVCCWRLQQHCRGEDRGDGWPVCTGGSWKHHCTRQRQRVEALL